MVLKNLVRHALGALGLEVRRCADPTLPMLHEFVCDGQRHRFWLANSFTKEWWLKPELPLDGEFSELKRFCNPGSQVVEVGAHHGMMTLLMSGWVGDEGMIHAIEASADNALVLDANCFCNQLRNVSTDFVAIGAKPGTVRFGGESLAAQSGVIREVPMTTLDAFCSTRGIGRVDVLKIDVEGYELDVLRGAASVLQQKPRLALEFHNDSLSQAGASREEIWDVLEPVYPAADREITMVCRPDWSSVRTIADFSEVLTTDVVNLFISTASPAMGR